VLFSLPRLQSRRPTPADAVLSHSATSDSMANWGNTLLIACEFPGRLRIACVHAGLDVKNFFAGIFSLQNSLRRESVKSPGCKSRLLVLI